MTSSHALKNHRLPGGYTALRSNQNQNQNQNTVRQGVAHSNLFHLILKSQILGLKQISRMLGDRLVQSLPEASLYAHLKLDNFKNSGLGGVVFQSSHLMTGGCLVSVVSVLTDRKKVYV